MKNLSIIIAVSDRGYDGVLLKIERDFLDGGSYSCQPKHNLVEFEWKEFHNFEECLGLEHTGLKPGVYRAEFDLIMECCTGVDGENDDYLVAANPTYTPVSWPDCRPAIKEKP